MSFDQLNANLSKGDWDMLMDAWTTGPDPTYLFSIQTCATLPDDNGRRQHRRLLLQPRVRQAVQAAGHTVDQAERVKTVAQMQDILYKANADIILYYNNSLSACATTRSATSCTAPDSDGFYPLQTGSSAGGRRSRRAPARAPRGVRISGSASRRVVVVVALAGSSRCVVGPRQGRE